MFFSVLSFSTHYTLHIFSFVGLNELCTLPMCPHVLVWRCGGRFFFLIFQYASVSDQPTESMNQLNVTLTLPPLLVLVNRYL